MCWSVRPLPCGGSSWTNYNCKACWSTAFSSCIYFLAGISGMVTMVHVSHSLASSEQPQWVILGLTSAWSQRLDWTLRRPTGYQVFGHAFAILTAYLCLYMYTHSNYGGTCEVVYWFFQKLVDNFLQNYKTIRMLKVYLQICNLFEPLFDKYKYKGNDYCVITIIILLYY